MRNGIVVVTNAKSFIHTPAERPMQFILNFLFSCLILNSQ